MFLTTLEEVSVESMVKAFDSSPTSSANLLSTCLPCLCPPASLFHKPVLHCLSFSTRPSPVKCTCFSHAEWNSKRSTVRVTSGGRLASGSSQHGQELFWTTSRSSSFLVVGYHGRDRLRKARLLRARSKQLPSEKRKERRGEMTEHNNYTDTYREITLPGMAAQRGLFEVRVS